jgi:hypothetical protein
VTTIRVSRLNCAVDAPWVKTSAFACEGGEVIGQKQAKLRADIYRQFKARDNVKPCCPSCGMVAPPHRRAIRWAELWGHRCPHGEPCPGFSKMPVGSPHCELCRPMSVSA